MTRKTSEQSEMHSLSCNVLSLAGRILAHMLTYDMTQPGNNCESWRSIIHHCGDAPLAPKSSRELSGVTLHDFGAHGAPRFVFLRFGFFPLFLSEALSRLFGGHLARLWGSWCAPICVPKIWINSLVCVSILSRDSQGPFLGE